MIKIKLSIDPTQPNQLAALTALLATLGMQKVYPTTMAFSNFSNPLAHSVGFETNEAGATITSKLDLNVHDQVQKQMAAEAEAPTTKPRRATKATPPAPTPETTKEADPTETNVKVMHPETKEEPTEEVAAPGATVEQIREMLGKKVTDHRETIKAKLTELGAKNVSVLDASHYTGFYNFISKL